MFEQQNLDLLNRPSSLLSSYMQRNLGVRIGQSTVFSQKVHTVDPSQPEAVTILQHADAGKVFYRRIQDRQIYHFDVFHQCGPVDHRKVARAVNKAIELFNLHQSMRNVVFLQQYTGIVRADCFDIQTSTGGGRVTGSLEYGKKLSLRRAHENHVHLAGMLPAESLACAFYIIQAVESIILDSGLELRANELLRHVDNPGGGGADLSPYSDQSDSFLQEKNPGQDSPALKRQQFMQDAAELAEEIGSAKDVYDALSAIEEENSKRLNSLCATPAETERICQSLSGMGIVSMKGDRPVLTQYGRELKTFLAQRLPDVESYIRRMYRLLKPYCARSGRTKALLASGDKGAGRRILCSEGTGGEVSLPETIQAAACRLAANPGGILRIGQADIRRSSRRTTCNAEICVLIDASASMAGQRMSAAKYLVRHLLLSTPDRVSVILFQEDRAIVQVPFTRDYATVQQSLKEITAIGSTPLGLGIKACVRYLDEARPKQPLILLVTDGVPTFADVTKDPVLDALNAAKKIKEKGYGFTCIGLRPHKDYLNRLAETAGGSVYMLEELEKQALVRTAWQEQSVGH
jgi:magnesium chelatase subunit D